MVEPSKRSRSVKKVKKKTPGGKTVTHYKAKTHSKQTCGRCSGLISGSLTGGKNKITSATKSQLKPARPFGGVLCNSCVDELVRYKTRFEATTVEGFESLDMKRDLTIEKYLPRGWFSGLSKK